MERTIELISGYERKIRAAIECEKPIGVILHNFMLEVQGVVPEPPKSKFMEEYFAKVNDIPASLWNEWLVKLIDKCKADKEG